MTRSEWMRLRRFLDLDREIDDAFGALIDEPWGRTPRADWIPAVDIDETREAYLVTVDLPGVCSDDVEVVVRPHEIEIHGSRSASRTTASAARIHTERISGGFRRTFPLDHPVDPQSAEHDCRDGVFQLRVRKVHPGTDRNATREDETP